ncbi:MAG: CehA/McbA family metallohydrolase [Pirellulales bacterium]
MSLNPVVTLLCRPLLTIVWAAVLCAAPILCRGTSAAELARPSVEDQPLAANCRRLLDTLQYLGAPLPEDQDAELRAAIAAEDGARLQELLDRQALFAVSINPELRVKVQRGPAEAVLQQGGFTPIVIKVLNDATLARQLRISSPQAGPLYAGVTDLILQRQAQTDLNKNENQQRERRFLDLSIVDQPPMTDKLSGLRVEYVLALIHCNESGSREATIAFDVGEGTQDLGFRAELPVLFHVRPANEVKLGIRDFDGQPTTARLEFRDRDGRVYPPQPKRLAPDFFFQPQIYRADGGTVLLPPGKFTLETSRGPEYVRQQQEIVVRAEGENSIRVNLQRWINPQQYGFWCGDHHIHGAGCSHYESPTQGVTPQDMFAQVQGEALNVGCVLTWGPCFEHQRNFFSPTADGISQPFTVLKYDLEISGFGSAALGHVCLLNLADQTYPGSNGTKTQGWPTWTVPVMKWAKEQGGVTGYPHSALYVDGRTAADWLITQLDTDDDRMLSRAETEGRLVPEPVSTIDADGNGHLTREELQASAERMANQLPNVALPAMDGGGAMEIVVSTPEGVCDFISAMDTARIPEWNTWYHLLNCGFPIKLSGETDFPCMSSRQVGQGRVYVQLGHVDRIDFGDWCRGLAQGRSYVSDGYAHALNFTVNGTSAGQDDVKLDAPANVVVETTVAFAPEVPRAVAYGTLTPPGGNRIVGDTINLHAPRDSGFVTGGQRTVELVAGGQVVAEQSVPADGKLHQFKFEVPVAHSTWLAIRQFPQLHTNPMNVIVADRPIRVSRASAIWCAESVRLLWYNRQRYIAPSERADARAAYQRALERYLQIAGESPANDSATDAAGAEPQLATHLIPSSLPDPPASN